MSNSKNLPNGASALALAAGLSAAALADQELTADPASNATAGGNSSDQNGISNLNHIGGSAFQGAKGIVSEVQNNGANSALNDDNTVSTIISEGQVGWQLRSDG